MTHIAKLFSLVVASVAFGASAMTAQTVTLTAQDRDIVIEACESGQDILPVAYDNGSLDGLYAVPVFDADGEAASAIMLTRRHIASLPQCDLSQPVQGFADDGEPSNATEDSA